MEPQKARLAFSGFLTLCALIVFNALFLQKDAGFVDHAVSRSAGSRIEPRPGLSHPTGRHEARQLDLLRAVRRELSAQNYFPGRSASGRLDAMTMAAIMAFQYDHDLPVTGKPSNELLKNILFGMNNRQEGMDKGNSIPADSSQMVAEIQGTLSALGLYRGKIDGLLGKAGQQAIRRFESKRGLPVSGRISGLLVQELMRVTGVEFSTLQ